jgi:flagellar motor switch protein FliM
MAMRPGGPAQEVKLYDFKRPERFSREQLRSLERVHERFARLLGQSLSAYLRTNVNIKLESVTPLSYQDFVFSLQQPTLITVLDVAPFPGEAALEVNPSFIFPMLEQMLGGRTGTEVRPRPLTDIELELSKRALERVLQCLTETWQEFVTVKLRMVRQEQDPQFAQVAVANTPVVVVSLEVTMGDDYGMMSLCMPDVLVEAIQDHMSRERVPGDRAAAEREARLVRAALMDVPLPMAVQLGTSQLTVAQVRALRVGDLVRLSTAAGADTTVRVASRPIFRARVGQLRSKLAVRVVEHAATQRSDPLIDAILAADTTAEATAGQAG